MYHKPPSFMPRVLGSSISLLVIVWIVIVTIRSEIWFISHCFGLGRDKMISAVCFTLFFTVCLWPPMTGNQVIETLILVDINIRWKYKSFPCQVLQVLASWLTWKRNLHWWFVFHSSKEKKRVHCFWMFNFVGFVRYHHLYLNVYRSV